MLCFRVRAQSDILNQRGGATVCVTSTVILQVVHGVFQVAKVAAAVALVALASDKVQKEYSARRVRHNYALHYMLQHIHKMVNDSSCAFKLSLHKQSGEHSDLIFATI